jgi:hypothetical protein
MRSNIDPKKIEQLMDILGKEARSSGSIYFTVEPVLYSLGGVVLPLM